MTEERLNELERAATEGLPTEDGGADWSGRDILELVAEIRRLQHLTVLPSPVRVEPSAVLPALKATRESWTAGTGYEQSDPGTYLANQAGEVICCWEPGDCGVELTPERAELAAQAPALWRKVQRLRVLVERLASSDEFAKDRPMGTLERDAFDVLRDA